MCLSVYVGTMRPLDLPGRVKTGALALERASWTPAPLERSAFVYYAGRQGERGVECSCLLSEAVEWTSDGATIVEDPLLKVAPSDPFETLRTLAVGALADAGAFAIVSDDSGGCAQAGGVRDYVHLYLPLSSIRRGGLIFADIHGGFPWRCYEVVPDAGRGRSDV